MCLLYSSHRGQSRNGKDAKIKSNIVAMTLPPRTPSLMPLDYSIWKQIVDKMVATAPAGTETKFKFLKRLRGVAKGRP